MLNGRGILRGRCVGNVEGGKGDVGGRRGGERKGDVEVRGGVKREGGVEGGWRWGRY